MRWADVTEAIVRCADVAEQSHRQGCDLTRRQYQSSGHLGTVKPTIGTCGPLAERSLSVVDAAKDPLQPACGGDECRR